MARELRTPEVLRQLADDAEDAASKLREVADRIEAEGMEGVLAHGGAVISQHLPKTWEWANALQVDLESQAKAHHAGRESRAAYDKRRHANRGRVSTTEPDVAPKKKATKKKKR